MQRVIYFIILIFLSNCGSPEKKIIDNSLPPQEQAIAVYKEGLEAIEKSDYFFAQKKFGEAEILLPQSAWAAKSALMSGYCFYAINFYTEAISGLERFTKTYPASKNLDYAHYLIAISYYEQILSEEKDIDPLLKSKEKIEFFLKKYPETDYAIDLKYKLELVINQLAAKEMYVARYYIKNEKWIAAINRLNNIITNYDDTIYVEEALHRLVEIYYLIGYENEAKKYAQTLGYNYQSSEWYKESYKLFNKDYKINKKLKSKPNKKKLIEKIKSFL